MPEATPAQLIEAAAACDFDFGGMWAERETWTPATTGAIRQQAQDAGVQLLDCEVARIMPGAPDPWLTELVEIAAELAEYPETQRMSHVRGAPFHHQTQGKRLQTLDSIHQGARVAAWHSGRSR